MSSPSVVMSIIERSIQASPIDPTLFDHFSSSDSSSDGIVDLVPCSGEDIPILNVPIETPLISTDQPIANPRLWNYRSWAHQLPYISEHLHVRQTVDGIEVLVDGRRIKLRRSGLVVEYDGREYSFPANQWPQEVRGLYVTAQEEIEKWRSRIVRLSMENSEFECSLMDTPLPPRTFLVEYKNSAILKSLRVHNGCLFFQTPARIVSVPVQALEEYQKVSDAVAHLAPELTVIDIDTVYDEFVQLRGLILDEDKRISQQRTTRGESADISTIDITLGAG